MATAENELKSPATLATLLRAYRAATYAYGKSDRLLLAAPYHSIQFVVADHSVSSGKRHIRVQPGAIIRRLQALGPVLVYQVEHDFLPMTTRTNPLSKETIQYAGLA